MGRMDVHHQISKHSDKQHKIVNEFLFWDEKREQFITEAVKAAQTEQKFDLKLINEATEKINEIAAAHGITPSRKTVTIEMVLEYAKKHIN
jgi:hypothetical protein